MTRPRRAVSLGLFVAGLALAPGLARASDGEPVKSGAPTLLLELIGRPVESRSTAYDDSLKDAGPAPRSPLGVVQPDGTVRYGSVTVQVKEACPEGAMLEPPPLPGRRRRAH
jgi:hypothetical protein